MGHSFKIIVAFVLYITLVGNLFGEDYSDLEETRVKVYGSEKDKKYRLDGFFIEWENWPRANPTHNHFHFFWFANYTNYPKFKKTQFFPLFYSIESKVDVRRSSNYFLLYNSNVDRLGNQSVSLFPIYFSGKGSLGSSYLGIFPLFFTREDNTEFTSQSKIVLPGFYKSQVKDSRSDFFSNESFSPFHYFNQTKGKGNEWVVYWFPLIPVIFQESDPNHKHNNYFWLLDIHKNKTTDTIDRFWFLPIFYWKRNSYLNVFPVYFSRVSQESDSKDWFGIIPPIYKSVSPDHSTFYFLNYYHSQKKILTKEESFFTFFPFYFSGKNDKNESFSMIPVLYFYQIDENKNKHTNVLLLYDKVSDENGNSNRFSVIPIYFEKKNSYKYIIPFYFSNSHDSKGEESSTWGPFYYSFKSKAKNETYVLVYYNSFEETKLGDRKNTLFFPLFYSWESTTRMFKEGRASKVSGYSFFPFFYHSEIQSVESYSNILGFISWTKDKDNNITQNTVFPFRFYEKDSYSIWFPFSFQFGKTDIDLETGVRWGPLYYYSWSPEEKDLWIGNYYSNTDQKNGKVLKAFFPFFYHSEKQSVESYSNILGFISWTKDQNNNVTQNTIFPFRFYKKDFYSIWFPFSFQFGKTDIDLETGVRFGPLYYSSWSPEENDLWVGPYYSNHDLKNQTQSKTFFPLYHSWKKDSSNGTILFPIYLDVDYRDENDKEKFQNFNLNVLGIASQTNKGIFQPDFSVDLGKKSKYYYLDTDISWLYYGFRVSNRTSTKLIDDLIEKTKQGFGGSQPESTAKLALSPKVEAKRSFTREDSFNFFGINVLFGVFGYEAADSKRHIRLLPLAWFTYDTEVDQNIYAGPLPLPFVWYSDLELKYRVIFPIYGYQKSVDAERHSYGLFVYLKESLAEYNTEETSILWPFVNWHSSEIKTGSRVLPFYWQRMIAEEDNVSDSMIFPLALTYLNTTQNTVTNEEKKTWISPVLLRWDEFLVDGKTIRSIPTIPFFYYSHMNTTKVDEKLFVSPVYLSWKSKELNSTNKHSSNFWLIPIVGFESKTNEEEWLNYFLIYNKSSSPKENSLMVFPLFSEKKQYVNSEFVQQTNFYFPVIPILTNHRPVSSTNPIESNSIYSPLFISSTLKSENETIYKEQLFPIPLFYSEYDKKKESSFWSMLLLLQSDSNPEKISYRFIPFIQFSAAKQNSKKEINLRNWVFPFFLKLKGNYYDANKNFRQYNEFYSIFYSSITNNEREIRLIPFIYYSSLDSEESFSNYLMFVNFTEKENFKSTNVFPFYHSSSSNGKSFNTSTDWLFPFYYLSAKNDFNGKTVEKTKVLPILFYYSKTNEEGMIRNVLFAYIQEENKRESSLSILPLFHSYSNKPKGNENSNSKSWFIPFYFYESLSQPNGTKISQEFYTFVYLSKSEFDTAGELFKTRKIIVPLFYSFEHNESFSEWTWLYIFQSKKEENKRSFGILPIFHSSYSEKEKEKESKNWLFPFYYVSSYQLKPISQNYRVPDVRRKMDSSTVVLNLREEDSFQILTPLFNYSSILQSPEKRDYETTLFFPIIPIFYREASNQSSHTNILYLFDRKVKNDQLTRLIAFPFYYSNKEPASNESVSYYHLFPIYFSGVDKNEYTAFIAGLYLNSNSVTSYKNFLYLLEQESMKTEPGFEFNILFRMFHFKSKIESKNFKLLYGVGELDLVPNRTQVNLVWLGYEKTTESKYLNLLPLYYSEDTKLESTRWITPFLYFSSETKQKKLKHSVLGLTYYNSENLETKESLENILFGIIYYKTVKPKERGYTGRGSLWGALWEYNTEEETKYSKFSILKILYSRREDTEGVRHRILFFEF